jgi:membrane protease YdiL (CAAX protease family)
MTIVALICFLVAYNNLINLWPPFNGPAYVPLNVATTLVLLTVGLTVMGLDPEELGLEGGHLTGALTGLAGAIALATPLLLLSQSRRAARVLADERVAGLAGAEIAFQVLVRIPLGTALLEEMAFRGILFGAMAHHGTVAAVVTSAVVFGLWHVTPTHNLILANRADVSQPAVAATICGAVLCTTLAGVALAYLRIRWGTLAAPFALHATLNSLATVAAVAAHRTLRDRSPVELT